MSKLGLSKELLLTPIYVPYFSKLIKDFNDHIPDPGFRKLNVAIGLFFFAGGLVLQMFGAMQFVAIALHIPGLGSIWTAFDMVARNYLFSLLLAWIMKKTIS